MLADDDRALLIGLAREAILCRRHGRPGASSAGGRCVSIVGGAFVTLTSRGELRGCIGQTEPDGPLGAVIIHCAAAAALADPRFPPVSRDELDLLGVEISVLTPPEAVIGIDQINVGRHGLIVQQGRHRGLLLPQVATEYGWSREEFLSHTCRKAGLPVDAWRRGAQIFCFEAEIFGDPGQHE